MERADVGSRLLDLNVGLRLVDFILVGAAHYIPKIIRFVDSSSTKYTLNSIISTFIISHTL